VPLSMLVAWARPASAVRSLNPDHGGRAESRGGAAGDLMGHSVSGAGDVNGDGFSDLMSGAIYDYEGGPNRGAACVVFGSDGIGGTSVPGGASRHTR